MSSQQLLVDITAALNGNKKKEKLTALENLTNLLNQERIVENIHASTLSRNNRITWDIIFIGVHNAVLSLIDENKTKSRQLCDKHIQIIQNAITQVAQKSVHQKFPLIKCSLIVSSVLAVFESDFRVKFIGLIYLNIFSKCVTSHRKNWCELQEAQWIGIKNICKDYFNNPPQGTHSTVFLEILVDVIRCSSKTCQISYKLLDLFEFIRGIFASYKGSASNFEIMLLHLTNTLCLQLAIEFRYSVCEFMETIFDFVISLHERKKLEKNILVYHFLMASLNIHNPNGLWNDKTSYAGDLMKWKIQIREMYFFCKDEVKLILRNSNRDVENDFLNLFVDVSHLISICGLESTPEVCDTDVSFDQPGPSNKRKCNTPVSNLFGKTKQVKLDGSLSNLFQDLQSPDGWFWLKFLELLLQKYPASVKTEYVQIVEFLSQLIYDNKEPQNLKCSLRCLCGLLEMENSLEKEQSDVQVHLLDDIWNKICLELLRNLNRQAYREAHSLLRALISHSKFRDSEALIKLYSNGILQHSLENFKTLCIVCQNCVIPEVLTSTKNRRNSRQNVEKVGAQLLDWLFQRKEEKYPCKEFAKVVTALIVKRVEEEIDSSVGKESSLIFQNSINDFCRLFSRNYMAVGFRDIKFVEDSKKGENNKAIGIDSNMKNKLFDHLAKEHTYLRNDLNNGTLAFDDRLKTVKKCLWFCELLCHLVSHFESLSDCDRDLLFLYDILQQLLHLSSTKSLHLLRVQFFDLTCFSNLFDGTFHVNVQKKIREPGFVNFEFLNAVFELFAKRDAEVSDTGTSFQSLTSMSRFSQLIKDPQSVVHFDILTRKEQLIVVAVEMLCQYVAVPSSSDSNRCQSELAMKIVDNLICDETFNVTSNFHLQLVLRVVYNFTNYEGVNIPVLNTCLDLLNLILDAKPSDFEVIITTLQVLKDLTALVYLIGDGGTHSRYRKIMEGFRTTVVDKRNCGIKVVLKFLECLTEISKSEKGGTWALPRNSDASLAEELIKFLKHPYHEVRLTAAQQVGLLFKSSDDSTVVWEKSLLKSLFNVLTGNWGSRFKEKESVVQYFEYVKSSIAMVSWASVICLSDYWRKKALFYLIYVAYIMKIKMGELEDIFKLICSELGVANTADYLSLNFPYLFHKWTKRGLQLEDFPYKLVGFCTLREFLLSNFPVIATVHSVMGQLNIFQKLSCKLNKSVETILKDCHSGLMAFILPGVSENAPSETAKRARALKKFIDGEVTSKTSCQWLAESLDEIIYKMIQNMHDPGYLLKMCDFAGNIKGDKGPASFTGRQITETVESLLTKDGKPLLGELALEEPSIIANILLFLLEDVEKAVVDEQRVFAFVKYIFFVELVSTATNKGPSYRPISTFFVRDVVYSVGTIVRKHKNETLSSMACECLRKLTNSYLKDFSTILGEFLPAITSILTPLAKGGNKKSLDLLNLLVCDNYFKLEPFILSLDPFPTDEIFSEINQRIQVHARDLESTINHFIKARTGKNSGCRIEGLRNLRRVLSGEKQELKRMFEHLKTLRGFSEDCKKSVLHQLVCMLMELSSDQNLNIRIEAAKCLGELGPCDLTTLVLRPEKNSAASIGTTSSLTRFLKSSIVALSGLVVNDDYNVKKASAKALDAILSTKQGKEIILGSNVSLDNVEYLTPFVGRRGCNLHPRLQKEILLNKLNESELWQPTDHEKWIVNLLDCLLESLAEMRGIVNSFRKLIQLNWQFAEVIFPEILDLILSLKDKDSNDIINKNVNGFFANYFEQSTNVNRTSLQCMVNVVDYIRIQRNLEGIYGRSDLNINYLHIAKAALSCSAFFTAIFYAELWLEDKKREDHFYADINSICEFFPAEGFALAEILRECHSKIGNSDGIHGCGYMHMLDPSSEVHHYEHLKNWNLSILHHDIRLCQGKANSESGLLNSLERSGMFYTLSHLMKEDSQDSEIVAVQYRCAANLLDWSQLDSGYKTKSNCSFDKCYYFALKAFHNEDVATFQNETQRARKSILAELAHCSLESSKNLYLPISKLQCLKELEEFCSVSWDRMALGKLFEKWDRQDEIKCNEFRLVESILMNRTIMIRDKLERTDESDLRDCLQLKLCEIYYKLTAAARREKKYETAIRTMSYLNNLSVVPEEMAGKIKVEKARIFWERGDKEIGSFLLSHFIKRNEIVGELKAKSLRIYGDWMAKTKSENSRGVIEKYYLKSIQESGKSKSRLHSFASLAKFADSNYEQLDEYLSSPLFEIKRHLINTQQDLASELRQELGWNQNREKRMAYQIAAKQSVIDENEIKNSRTERDSYLSLALKYYLLSLKEGEKHNLVVFRVVSLWLSNASNPELVQLQKILHHIPTYKFLCLLPQLIPRMADVCLISDLVEQILQDHPHHTLPLLFALKNSYEDLKYNGVKMTLNTPRVLAAKGILEKFQNHHKLKKLIEEMQCFTEALIELANYSPPQKGSQGLPIDLAQHLRIRRIRNLSSVCVPSLHIPFNKNCAYDSVVGVQKFEPWYYLVGGINVPKKVVCVGSDGVGRHLLVKGRDDLRQDAVMQQVFTIMNSLLKQNSETNKRKLVIRTYKVVPLSQRSGVIEWCENTQPLCFYLTGPDGTSGAHKKFRPKDVLAYDCKCQIKKVFSQPHVTNQDKLKVFLDVCKKIHPVFHKFFIEKFPAAGVWFERRLAYIHSVATSSMIGYILGIGDRHLSNILIDNSTAEVIHIDLGIAFEQGKTLPTPETVPFRLTRDIVDGMGLSGVEGDFRISCIKTMEVLRENQDTILTLLEVLLYDPLYTWTITPEKAYSIQNQGSDTSSTTAEKSSSDMETNKMAERALIRLKQKLQGTEAGYEATNVEGQVNYLIQQARDPNNLCRLFYGWQAYL